MHRAILVALLSAHATVAFASPALDGYDHEARDEQAREASKTARRDAQYTFCNARKTPLSPAEAALCPFATEIEDCAGFQAACQTQPPKQPPAKTSPWLESLGKFLASVAHVLLWLLIVAVVAVLLVPIVLAIVRQKRDKRLSSTKPTPNHATSVSADVPDAMAVSDAQAAMHLADEHARRGEYARAMSLYLAATLTALASRGALELARHRTNGEYVRSCRHEASRGALREIVAEVDKTEFGHIAPTAERAALVASRAASIVRTFAMTTLVAMVFFVVGCTMQRIPGKADPEGDALPMEILSRSGFDVGYLQTSLASMPIPEDNESATMPIVVVDAARVHLDAEPAAHLMRWVERGGVLVLLDSPERWPGELQASRDEASTRDLRVFGLFGVRVARQDALVLPNAVGIAHLGEKVYAAIRPVGRGAVLGVANDDLFTNIGAAHPDNAAALVRLFDLAYVDGETARDDSDDDNESVREAESVDDDNEPVSEAESVETKRVVRVARELDGISPPTTPTSALSQTGLDTGTWHALGASLLLFAAVGARQARPKRTNIASRRAFREHVEATGALYGRAGATVHALASYGRFVEMRLRERLPKGTDPAAFLAARAGLAPDEIAKIFQRIANANTNDPPKGDELEMIEKLRAAFVKSL
jgi:hypothetical protein